MLTYPSHSCCCIPCSWSPVTFIIIFSRITYCWLLIHPIAFHLIKVWIINLTKCTCEFKNNHKFMDVYGERERERQVLISATWKWRWAAGFLPNSALLVLKEYERSIFCYFYMMLCSLLYYNYLGMLLMLLTPNYMVAAILSSAYHTMLNLFSGFFILEPVKIE